MRWESFVLTTDRSMIPATRYHSEDLTSKGPLQKFGRSPSRIL
jgi:hypothetical protein